MYTARFNFRGCGISRGKGEIQDIVNVVITNWDITWCIVYAKIFCFTHQVNYMLTECGTAAVPPPTKIILVGYSYGSMIASAAAGQHPNIVGFVALSSPFSVYWALSLLNGNTLCNAAKEGDVKASV